MPPSGWTFVDSFFSKSNNVIFLYMHASKMYETHPLPLATNSEILRSSSPYTALAYFVFGRLESSQVTPLIFLRPRSEA